jgi:hypothetical protein
MKKYKDCLDGFKGKGVTVTVIIGQDFKDTDWA